MSAARCYFIDTAHLMPGWGCCQCRAYNGMQRASCKACQHPRCSPLEPDRARGTTFDTRHYHRTG